MKNTLYIIIALLLVTSCSKKEDKPYEGHWIVGMWNLDSSTVVFEDTTLTDEEKGKYVLIDTLRFESLTFYENGKAIIQNKQIPYTIISDSTWTYGVYNDSPYDSRASYSVSDDYTRFHTYFPTAIYIDSTSGIYELIMLHTIYLKSIHRN